ncbi:MAG TPA: hypothetical protein EYQ50_06095 [Verrucomicrobiales bacterium]|nr:hypothetical protein [Verrucomicrobiales bacterium]HIL69240.1 hypothetical protein [Verrucomicrobiota bacterium]
MSDDMSWGELGMSGNKIINTPNLDKLSADSLRSTNFHVAPSCAPTRAKIMSERHEFSVWQRLGNGYVCTYQRYPPS